MKANRVLCIVLALCMMLMSTDMTVLACEPTDVQVEESTEETVSQAGVEVCAESELTVEASEVLASDIVNYANSFVGKLPYVSGGTSLTTGADCSGFICAIFAHFGFDLWSNRTSLRNLPASKATNIGTNMSNALPGDIITLESNGSKHVGIYAGGG